MITHGVTSTHLHVMIHLVYGTAVSRSTLSIFFRCPVNSDVMITHLYYAHQLSMVE